MGFFDKFKSARDIAKEEIKEMPWEQLERMEQLDELTELSKSTPVVIFKHSTTCGISRMALRGFENNYDYKEGQLKAYFLDLKQYREISNAIAERFNVQHESPQLLLIKNGTVTYHTSHSGIDAAILGDKI